MTFWQTLTARPLTLDQTDLILTLDRAEIEQVYLPLAGLFLGLAAQRRCLVAIAGPTATGKSVFAAILAAVANALAQREIAAVVGLDGWHYPNAYLDSHTTQRKGQNLPLRRIKGTPETYDAAAALSTLAAVRADLPELVRFPVYSRALHDPLPDAGSIQPHHRLVLFEGNYWLLDHLPWSEGHACLDRRIFLRGDPQSLITGLRERFLRGGRDPQDVEAHIQSVDVPNMRLILEHSVPADWTVHKADGRRILGVTPPLPKVTETLEKPNNCSKIG